MYCRRLDVIYTNCGRRGSYGDRKKKIIQEWNKTNKSPRPPETLTSADPLRGGGSGQVSCQ